MQSPVLIVFNKRLKPLNIVRMEKLIYRLLKLKFRVAIVIKSPDGCCRGELDKKYQFGTIAKILAEENYPCNRCRGIVEILETR